jgi:hypothetical protein
MSSTQNAPQPAPQYQFAWTEASTVAAGVGIIAVIVTFFTLTVDRIRRGRLADPHEFATRESEMGYFWVEKMGWWDAFWMQTTEAPEMTTVRGLIQAGDMNLWSSSAFDQLEPYHQEVSWTPIYSAIFSQMPEKLHSKSNSGEDIDDPGKRYLERASEDVKLGRDNGERRRNLIAEGVLVCCIRPLDEVDEEPWNGPVESNRRPLQKSLSSTFSLHRVGTSETTYKVTSREKSLNNLEKIWMRSGKPCIEISREELLALSLTLGITLQINDFTQNVRGLGPFGTGLNVVQDNGEWKLEMVHGARLPRHEASKGSGYTPLFAKHIAFGSLPFADAKNWVRSVYVNDEVLEAIKRGHSIVDGWSFGGRPFANSQTTSRFEVSRRILSFGDSGRTKNSTRFRA